MTFDNSLRRAPTAGNTLLMVLITIAVLSLIGGNLMWSASARYHTTYQSASWQEALVAAEAGVDLAMVELRTRVSKPGDAFQSDPWQSENTNTTENTGNPNIKAYLGGALDPTVLTGPTNPGLSPFPDNGHARPLRALPNVHGGEGNTTLAVRVYVDAPDSYAAVDKTLSDAQKQTALAQAAPGTDPVDTGLQFINQPDSGDPERDNRNRLINSSRWWWRIRSVGYAGVSGPTRPSTDWRDNRLRKFSFFTDWRNGRAAQLPINGASVPAPQVSRAVEVLVRPYTRTHFALLTDKQIDLSDQSVRVDSYDSSKGGYAAVISTPPASESSSGYTAPGNATDPNGQTNPNAAKNIGWMGNIATNGQLINASGANVQGNAMTNSGTVDQAQNVTGSQDPNFYQELTPIKAINWDSPPAEWAGVPNSDTIRNTYNMQASTDPTNPTHLRVNGIDLTNGNKMFSISPPPARPDGTIPPGFVKIYVDGDLRTSGNGVIDINENVTAIISVTGSVSLQGAGINNNSKAPTQLIINGIQPADGTVGGSTHQITITPDSIITGGGKLTGSGKRKGGKGKDDEDDGKGGSTTSAGITGDFNGIIYAPQHDLNISGTSPQSNYVFDYCGAFVANKATVNVHTQIHYDESLRANGQLGGYKIVKWFEDTASHYP